MANNQQAYSFYCSVKVGGAPYIQVRSIVRNLGYVIKEETAQRFCYAGCKRLKHRRHRLRC